VHRHKQHEVVGDDRGSWCSHAELMPIESANAPSAGVEEVGG
jgi:hypothetical protein